MSISIKIENFEGPFDLLLHLIKKNKMDIYDVKIAEITAQYLEYLNQIREMDLEITSEFIVIASTLLEIKSKELLPKTELDENEQEDGNSKEELIKKLIQYRKFKEIANFLREREICNGVMYSKKPEIIEEKKEINPRELLKGTTLIKLYNLFIELVNNYYDKLNTENKIPKQLPIDRFKIEDKMNYLSQYFMSKRRSTFSDTIYSCDSKMEVIVTFLAMLELIRLKRIKVVQEDNFMEIYMEGVEENGGN